MIIYAGIDDGHRELKAKFSNGMSVVLPSRAVSGLVNKIAINGTKSSIYPYETGEGIFTMGDVENAEETAYDGYPFSAQNRVIVAHGLRMAGMNNECTLHAVTGLPLKRYYLRGSRNLQVINAKKENLLKNDVVGMDGYAPPTIAKHDVLSEGIAAWIGYVLQRNSDNVVTVDRERLTERTAIVDIGGRTLDIAVIKNWDLDGDRSGSEEIGMITILNGLSERLFNQFDGLQLTDEQIEGALKTSQVKVYGQVHDVTDIVTASIMTAVNSLRSSIKRRLGEAGDIDNVFFVGGTTQFLGHRLDGWFRNQRIMDDPTFANADGMLKYAEMTMGGK